LPHLGQPGRDVVQGPGERRTFRRQLRLYPDAVGLPLHPRRGPSILARASSYAGLAKARESRPGPAARPSRGRNAPRLAAASQRRRVHHAAERAAHHHGPSAPPPPGNVGARATAFVMTPSIAPWPQSPDTGPTRTAARPLWRGRHAPPTSACSRPAEPFPTIRPPVALNPESPLRVSWLLLRGLTRPWSAHPPRLPASAAPLQVGHRDLTPSSGPFPRAARRPASRCIATGRCPGPPPPRTPRLTTPRAFSPPKAPAPAPARPPLRLASPAPATLMLLPEPVAICLKLAAYHENSQLPVKIISCAGRRGAGGSPRLPVPRRRPSGPSPAGAHPASHSPYPRPGTAGCACGSSSRGPQPSAARTARLLSPQPLHIRSRSSYYCSVRCRISYTMSPMIGTLDRARAADDHR